MSKVELVTIVGVVKSHETDGGKVVSPCNSVLCK